MFENLAGFLSERVTFKFDMITAKSYYLTVLDNQQDLKLHYDMKRLQSEVDAEFNELLKMKLAQEWDHISIDRWRGDELDNYENLAN